MNQSAQSGRSTGNPERSRAKASERAMVRNASISPIAPGDFDEWMTLWNGYLTFYEVEVAEEVSRTTFHRIANDVELHGAIARNDDGEAIGLVHWLTHAATWSPAGYCYLEDLFVTADARGAGTGRALIHHVREWAREHGASKLYWLTQEENSSARKLYDALAEHTGYTHYEINL